MKQSSKVSNIHVGVYLPEKVLTNQGLEERKIILSSGKQLRADRILDKIGVERRHIAREDETIADMGLAAAKKAAEGFEKVDLIMVSSSHPSNFNAAAELRERLGFKNAEIMDVHAACSGSALIFSYLFENGDKYVNKRILMAAADKFSDTLVDLTRPDAMQLDSSLGQTIFGDGAAALSFVYGRDIIVLGVLNRPLPEPGGKKDLIFMGMGENKFVEPCIVKPVAVSRKQKDFPNGYFTQNGPKVFEVVNKYVPSLIREAVMKTGLESKDIDLVVIHPGSKRVVEAIRDSLKPDFEVFSDYADGNMSSVSLLYSFIKALQEERIGKGSRVVLCGFGAGSPDLYSSTVVIELS